MTIFGIIWLLIILWCCSRQDVKYMLFFTLLFMTFQCDNVIVIGEKGIGPGIITSIIFVVYYLIRNKFNIFVYRGSKLVIVTLLGLVLLIIYSSYKNAVFKTNIIYILQFLCYVLCFFAMFVFSDKIKKADLYNIIRTIVIFHCVFGFVQILASGDILPIRQLLKILFFNDSSKDVVFNKPHYTRLMSTFMEPSYFSGFAVGAFYFLLTLKSEWLRNKYIFLALFVEIMLTQSSTAYAAFCITGMVFICMAKEISVQMKIGFIVIGIAAMLILYFGFYDILDSVIFSKDKTGSGMTRMGWNKNAFYLFKTSPIYGVGYKNCRGSSLFYSILGQLGLLGLILYLLLNVNILLVLKNNNLKCNKIDNINYFVGLFYAIITIVICQLIACPDLDLCTYWFWLYCAALCYEHTFAKSGNGVN